MAQPNVAREPSMEEILASIRKIIENNDPEGDAQQTSPLSAAPRQEGISSISGGAIDPFAGFAEEPEQPAASRTAAGILPGPVPVERPSTGYSASISAANQGTSVRAAQQPVDGPREATPRQSTQQPEQSKNLSLADVAARVRAASERNAEMLRARGPEPAGEEPEMQAPVEPQRPAATAVPQAAKPAIEPHRATAVVPEVKTPAAPASPTPAVAAQKPADIKPAPAEASASGAPVESRGNLISAMVGAQVARSFGDLAEAIDGAQKRSLDEIAEDMLRPMLQEWLDDNLPGLVERLVREEIERVARGARR